MLRELYVSYNRLSRVPPELGNCEKLERLELAGNHNLSELPFEVRGKRVKLYIHHQPLTAAQCHKNFKMMNYAVCLFRCF